MEHLTTPPAQRVKLGVRQSLGLIGPYVLGRLLDQLKSVWVIVLYLILFQTLVLGVPIAHASVVALGLLLVIFGLACFLEGVLIGLMPLGEIIGLRLPQASRLPVILAFAFVLGVGATLAEPAVGILKVFGSSVKAWDAPLLFLLLNRHSDYLVASIGVGVGIAVLCGMLRFLYAWSLKPFLYVLVALLGGLTLWASADPNLVNVVGLAWDCGAITTGPVTVPLVLALGIGISRMMGSGDSGTSGFGVVTLASLFPVLTVLLLGIALHSQVPAPMPQEQFLNPANRARIAVLFEDEPTLAAYVLQNASRDGQVAFFGAADKRLTYLRALIRDPDGLLRVFGSDPQSLRIWFMEFCSDSERRVLIEDACSAGLQEPGRRPEEPALWSALGVVRSSLVSATRAVVPLSLFLLLVLFVLLREKLARADEVVFGIVIAVIGMGFFNIGLETGLAKLGAQAGATLPASFTSVELRQDRHLIPNFTTQCVYRAVDTDGRASEFFYYRDRTGYNPVVFESRYHDVESATYTVIPRIGPLFGGTGTAWGFLIVLFFAFMLGYGATLAEPALIALGMKVEELTIGTLRRSHLTQSVAMGVGIGLSVGVAKVLWEIPLAWLLIPPYVLLLFLTRKSAEGYVNIGWDSAGVTTGPVTVPLVLAVGLGLSRQIGATEGFGILAMASAYPILTVLLMGLHTARKRRRMSEEPANPQVERKEGSR